MDDDRPSESDRPTKRRVRFSEEFEPPFAPQQRTTSFRPTPILRAPPSNVGTPAQQRALSQFLQHNPAPHKAYPSANGFPPFVSSLSNGAGPSHSPRPTGLSLHHAPTAFGAGPVHTPNLNGRTNSFFPNSNGANASHFPNSNYVSPFRLSTSNGAGPSHSPNPTRLSTGQSHSFNPTDLLGPTQPSSSHTPSANHTRLSSSANFQSAAQAQPPTVNGSSSSAPNVTTIAPPRAPTPKDPASSAAHAAIETVTPPTKKKGAENESVASSPSSPKESVAPSKDEAGKAPVKKPEPRNPCFNCIEEGMVVGSMAIPTPEHMKRRRPRKPRKAPAAYYPYTASEISPWRRVPPSLNASPVSPEESRDVVHVRYTPVPSPAMELPRRSLYNAMSSPSMEFEPSPAAEMDHPAHSPRRLSYGLVAAFAVLLFFTVMGFARMESKPKYEATMCSVHDARQYDGGWSVLVKYSGSLLTSMWLENESAHTSDLKDRCSSYSDCGEIKLPCVETGSGSMRLLEGPEFFESRSWLIECLSNMISCMARLVFKVTGFVLLSPLYILRAIPQFVTFVCRIYGQCLMIMLLHLVPMWLFKVFILDGWLEHDG